MTVLLCAMWCEHWAFTEDHLHVHSFNLCLFFFRKEVMKKDNKMAKALVKTFKNNKNTWCKMSFWWNPNVELFWFWFQKFQFCYYFNFNSVVAQCALFILVSFRQKRTYKIDLSQIEFYFHSFLFLIYGHFILLFLWCNERLMTGNSKRFIIGWQNMKIE